MKTETPLLKFLRALSTEDRGAFAKECDTTLIYLYQVAANAEPNPRLRLAKALVERSREWAKRIPRVLRVTGLTYDDLLVGAEEIPEPKVKR